ncbi:MAG TPA: hypothetical protein PKO33_06370, partial [Pyrinomonadaceae bacterium]|nr:hypothetical protein [Pyrinomonadaceae bacterium]
AENAARLKTNVTKTATTMNRNGLFIGTSLGLSAGLMEIAVIIVALDCKSLVPKRKKPARTPTPEMT